MPDYAELLTETDPKVYIDAMVAGSAHLRALRHLSAEVLAELTDDELEGVARWCRAVSHSALEGARKLDQIVRART